MSQNSVKGYLKKCAKWSGALLLLCLLALFYLLVTENGCYLVLRMAAAVSQHTLRIENVNGRLLDRVTLTGVSLKRQGMESEAQEITLDWRPLKLLQGELHIRELLFVGVVMDIASSDQEIPKERTPLDLGFLERMNLHWPVSITVGKLVANNTVIGMGETRYRITTFEMGTSLLDGRFQIVTEHLDAQGVEIEARISALAEKNQGVALQGWLEWRYHGLPFALAGRAELSGQLNAFRITHQLSLPLAVSSEVRLDINRGAPEVSLHTSVPSGCFPEEVGVEGCFDAFSVSLFWAEGSYQGRVEGGVKLPAAGELFLQLPFAGTLNHLRIDDAQVKTDMGNVQWSADVRLDQQQIVWDVEMDIPDLPLKDRFPKIAGKSGSFGLKGGGRVDLITLDVSATWEWFLKGLLPPFSELAGTMNISGNREALSFDHRMQQPGELILQGEVSGVVSGALQVEADLTWKEWRLDASFTDAFQFLETSGRVHFSGNRERYQATLASSLQPHPFGLTQLTLVVDGHAGGIEDLRLEWQPQTGKAVMAGQVNWQQGFTIDLGLSLEEMDPSEWLAAWPGHVSAKVHLNARQDSPASSEWPIFDITLESLQGELQKIPFSGQGRIQGGGEQIVIERLQLDALSGQISANGTLSSSGKTQVDLFLDLPELALWKPGAQGKVKASGVLSGSLADPALSLRIDGWDTAYEQVAIERWGLDLTGGGAWREGGEVKFSAQQLSALGQHWTALDLLFQGGRLEQEILLRTEGEWALTLMGKGDWAGSQWQGALHTFSLENERIGKWNNSDVWKVNWEEGLARLDAGCLQSGGNRFCVSAQGGPNQDSTMRMQVNMTEYPFLDKVLAVPVQLEGNVSAVIEAERLASGKLNATASLLSEEGRLVFPGESGRSMEVPFEIEALTLVLNPQKIEGQWAVRFFEKERLEGNVRLHSSAKEWGYDEISAKAHADFSNFMILSALVPEVSIPSGALKADLRMEGEVSSPEIWGEATVKNGRLMVDEMGLVMDQFELQATWSGQEAQLRLETVSGAGRLGVEAEASLQALSRWHLSGRVRGQDFPVANTTAYQVDVSPDLSFDLTPQRLTIEGEVIVPRARVVLRELPPSGIRVSQDVIVVDAESPRTARKSQWDARLTLKTGKEVFFKGFGLEGMIDGDLLFERKPESGEALFGELSVRNGRYRALGYHLDIVRGTVVFAGSPRNPGLDVAAERRLLSGQAVPVIISGTVLEPVLQLPQSNELGESDAFSRLLTGRGVGASGSDVLSDQVTMMGIGITENLTQGLADDFGLDTAGLKTEAGLETTSLYLGKQITPLLYVGYDIGLFDTERKVEVKLKLGRRWSLEAASGNDSGADFIYSYETRPPVSRSATRERVQDTKDSVSAPPESPDFSSEKHSAQSNSE